MIINLSLFLNEKEFKNEFAEKRGIKFKLSSKRERNSRDDRLVSFCVGLCTDLVSKEFRKGFPIVWQDSIWKTPIVASKDGIQRKILLLSFKLVMRNFSQDWIFKDSFHKIRRHCDSNVRSKTGHFSSRFCPRKLSAFFYIVAQIALYCDLLTAGCLYSYCQLFGTHSRSLKIWEVF